MRKIELLAPAGNLEKLKTAIVYGADAVYLGGLLYNLRAQANNFTLEEIKEGIAFAHSRGAKVFVTLNIIAHNEDLKRMPEYVATLRDLGVDALIVADAGVLNIVKEVAPEVPIHLSTQASITNWRSVKFWAEQGVSRIILARELTAVEIREIAEHVNVELEVFVHGAMCVSYSGRCLLSNYLTGRDSNRGACAQPCRWKYHLVEETRPGEYYPVEESERGTFIMNSKDMCQIEHIPELMNLGVSCFKIEGRMKSINYVAGVTRAYRNAIDSYLKDPKNFVLQSKWVQELEKVSHRKYFTGFMFDRPNEAFGQNYESSGYIRSYDFVGVVKDYDATRGRALIEQRNVFAVGEEVEIMNPHSPDVLFSIADITDAKSGHSQERAPHGKQLVYCSVPRPVEPFAIMRRKVE